jgi:hypothetical protein
LRITATDKGTSKSVKLTINGKKGRIKITDIEKLILLPEEYLHE